MSSLHASSLYNVDGLVALITGGGTGKYFMLGAARILPLHSNPENNRFVC
jgi:hypothetical protein